MEASPAGTERQGRGDVLLQRGPHAADTEAKSLDILALSWSWRSPASCGQEEESGPLLIRVPERTSVAVGARHPATLDTPAVPCLINPGNYN
jgi:hypothetical protein